VDLGGCGELIALCVEPSVEDVAGPLGRYGEFGDGSAVCDDYGLELGLAVHESDCVGIEKVRTESDGEVFGLLDTRIALDLGLCEDIHFVKDAGLKDGWLTAIGEFIFESVDCIEPGFEYIIPVGEPDEESGVLQTTGYFLLGDQ